MPKDSEQCKRGALSIEREIDRRLELLKVPIPSRTWLIDVERKYTAEVEITYDCNGKRTVATFSSEEIRTFRHHPMPSTLRKIERIANEIGEAYLLRRKS